MSVYDHDNGLTFCPECRQPVHMGSDGFYFHDGLPCTIRATLDAVDADGNYPDDDEVSEELAESYRYAARGGRGADPYS